MNRIAARLRRLPEPLPHVLGPLGAFGLFALASLASFAAAQTPPQNATGDFGRLASQLTAGQPGGASGSEAVQEQALAMLDRVALQQLNASPSPNLGAINQQLASFVTHEPAIGENYRVVQLGTNPSAYALVANFGSAGPSAIRIYAGMPGSLKLAGRIDRYAQKDFFDDYLELLPLTGVQAFAAFPPGESLFLTVAGRTDELQSGVFTAWRLDSRAVSPVWTSDILEQSDYVLTPSGLRLVYCAESDPATDACRKPVLDTYAWRGGQWTRVSTQDCASSGSCH